MLLHCKPELVSPVLEDMARKGLPRTGCEIWSYCRGTDACTDKLLYNVQLFTKDSLGRKDIGMGMVDPFTTFLEGEKIGKGRIVVRFTQFFVETVKASQDLSL